LETTSLEVLPKKHNPVIRQMFSSHQPKGLLCKEQFEAHQTPSKIRAEKLSA
jgi:hypothetical protein